MNICSNCGKEFPNRNLECPFCGSRVSSRKEEIIKEIDSQEQKRKRAIATFLLAMFGMWIFPSRKIILMLAIISFGIIPSLIVYHTWEKKQAKNKLEKETEAKKSKNYPDNHENIV